jgi:hypothetical protein
MLPIDTINKITSVPLVKYYYSTMNYDYNKIIYELIRIHLLVIYIFIICASF